MDGRLHGDGARAQSMTRFRGEAPGERLRRLADQWPSFDDEERALLESHLHRLHQKSAG